MISYELAKELKEAGFPHKCSECCDHCHFACKECNDKTGYFCCPPLTEIIEECDKDIVVTISQEYVANPDIGGANNDWFAGEYNFYDSEWVRVCGAKTLEDAVAKLWLTLNKHDA